MSLDTHPHRRWNPLKEEWILVSPQRGSRPWQGAMEAEPEEERPVYEAGCYLCPGNRRSGGAENPRYEGTFVFTNDFPALREETPAASAPDPFFRASADGPLFRAEAESGICRVICFSPRHDLTLAELPLSALEAVVETWTREYEELMRRADIAHVMTFENKGSAMGCSNPHPHGQIWATRSIPTIPKRSAEAQARYAGARAGGLLEEYAREEIARNERLVLENEDWLAMTPYWAEWPFELMLLPRRRRRSLLELSAGERRSFAAALQEALVRLDNIFETSFPYSLGVYQAPKEEALAAAFHMHVVVSPPLLRSRTVRKFMVGYEMFAETQRDLTPESAAERIRSVPAVHYKSRRPAGEGA